MFETPLDRSEKFCLFTAVLIGCGFFVHQYLYPSVFYDAFQYQLMGRELVEFGLSKFGSSIRTYGYPLLLSGVHIMAKVSGASFVAVAFILQFAGYVATSLFFRSALARVAPVAIARLALIGLLTNFYVLLYTSELLTESVSVSLTVLAAGCWLRAYAGPRRLLPVIAGSFVVGFAMEVRPANLALAATWLAGLTLIGWRLRAGLSAGRLALCTLMVLFFVGLPTLPQLAHNVLRLGRWTPLIADSLGAMQQIWGVQNLKYATAVPPVTTPQIFYENPLAAGTVLNPSSPMRWYLQHPARGVLTTALHTFNMLDQDLLFTYSRDLTPWYRVPLGVVNHLMVALGLIGLGLLARVAFATRHTEVRDLAAVLALALITNWGLHATTVVEMRFGLILLLALWPLAIYAMTRMAEAPLARTLAAGAGMAAYVALALLLSDWVRAQAPNIRAASNAVGL